MTRSMRTAVAILTVVAVGIGALQASGIWLADSLPLKIVGIAAALVAGTLAVLKSGGIVSALLPLALVLGLGASGCCTTARCYLARAQSALELADPIALAAMRAACTKRVEAECKGKGETCPAFVACKAAVVGYRAGSATAGKGIIETNRALHAVGVP